MWKLISHSISAIMLLLIISNLSCASLPSLSPPVLENRELDIDLSNPGGYIYKYPVCVKHFLGICTKKESHIDRYDLNDPIVQKQFFDMGFVLKARKKF